MAKCWGKERTDQERITAVRDFLKNYHKRHGNWPNKQEVTKGCRIDRYKLDRLVYETNDLRRERQGQRVKYILEG